jgi:hypothetical protein
MARGFSGRLLAISDRTRDLLRRLRGDDAVSEEWLSEFGDGEARRTSRAALTGLRRDLEETRKRSIST